MISLEKTAAHRVYRTELYGDTMVVTLQGDAAGFGVGTVHNEMATLIGIARQPEVRHLIIDMSGSNYYGSMILGEIVNLAQAFREKGGRRALSGISPDMKEILRIMRLDGMWERYPTRSMAQRALAHVPWRDRLKPLAKPALIAAAVLMCIALYVFVPRPDYTGRYYESAATIWNEAEKLQRAGVSDTEWQLFSTRAKEKLENLTRSLERMKPPRNQAARNLLVTTRDHAPDALDQRLNPQAPSTVRTKYHLAVAKAYLEHADLPELPKQLEEESPEASRTAREFVPPPTESPISR